MLDVRELADWMRQDRLRGELHDLSQPMADGMLIPPALRAAGQRVTIEPLATHERNGFELTSTVRMEHTHGVVEVEMEHACTPLHSPDDSRRAT